MLIQLKMLNVWEAEDAERKANIKRLANETWDPVIQPTIESLACSPMPVSL
jgi:hypothetical protein